MARIDKTDDWRDRHAPTLSAFESLAIEAYGHLPEEFRALTKDLIIEIADFPTDEVFEDMALETPFDLLGLFEGRGISERFTMETGEMVNRIILYRRPILDYWAENEETLGDIITHVLIHESAIISACRTTTWSASKKALTRRRRIADPPSLSSSLTARPVSCPDGTLCLRRFW